MRSAPETANGGGGPRPAFLTSTAPSVLRNRCVGRRDYQPPFPFTGKLQKVTLSIDGPVLTPEDVKKLKEAQERAAAQTLAG